ncbi:hypothetical protein VTK73DRAFT_7670 [Phialemonium thermophilum]|uniref:Uncharacterized protein n=1 Tax=Phialemonium thermophilum TaxID=223376 RepID=A0ABR3Y7R8_9PEZI
MLLQKHNCSRLATLDGHTYRKVDYFAVFSAGNSFWSAGDLPARERKSNHLSDPENRQNEGKVGGVLLPKF